MLESTIQKKKYPALFWILEFDQVAFFEPSSSSHYHRYHRYLVAIYLHIYYVLDSRVLVLLLILLWEIVGIVNEGEEIPE